MAATVTVASQTVTHILSPYCFGAYYSNFFAQDLDPSLVPGSTLRADWADLGFELLCPRTDFSLNTAHPVFGDALREVCAALDPLLGVRLLDVMTSGGAADGAGGAPLDRTEFTQPALFAFQTALFRLVESWGVRPDALSHCFDHSQSFRVLVSSISV